MSLAEGAPIGLGRRALLAALLAALAVGVTAALGFFLWPSSSVPREVVVGPASAFAPGTVRSFLIDHDRVRELSVAGDYGPRPEDYPDDGRQVFHVARLDDGQLRAFFGADLFEARVIVWFPLALAQWAVDPPEEPGLFSEPRRGNQWTIAGEWVFGPGPPRLDELDIWTRADGSVAVDIGPIRDDDREFIYRAG